MNPTTLERKVGLFVAVGLALLVALVILFSKGVSLNLQTYNVQMRTSNVGGLKRGAAVLMSGVQVGTVSAIRLAPDGRTVTVTLRLVKHIPVFRDAKFYIEQSGFLGDQYVTIVQGTNTDAPLRDGDVVSCEPPFNLLEVARATAGFINRIEDIATKIDSAVAELRRFVLNQETLSNVAVTVNAMRTASEHAAAAASGFNALFATNADTVTITLTNFAALAERLNKIAGALDELTVTNAPEVASAIRNLESSAAALRELLTDMHAGKGLAGTLLRNESLATHVSMLASNLAITSSNLNRLGLWGILWKPKQPRTNVVTKPVYPGRTPFD
ncbi:MAG: MlaD family protein [Verrucomicrobiae bacterium]|nr:MlaD family protein [Verrucomicrobiae bacterium]